MCRQLFDAKISSKKTSQQRNCQLKINVVFIVSPETIEKLRSIFFLLCFDMCQGVLLVSLLLALNVLHTLFYWCFYCEHWTCNCHSKFWLKKLILSQLKFQVFRQHVSHFVSSVLLLPQVPKWTFQKFCQ